MSKTTKELSRLEDDEVSQTDVIDANDDECLDDDNLGIEHVNMKLIDNLEMLNIEMDNACAILDLIRIANEGTDGGINQANAMAAGGVSTYLGFLKEKYVTPSIDSVLGKGSDE